jgi:hypothetical protein
MTKMPKSYLINLAPITLFKYTNMIYYYFININSQFEAFKTRLEKNFECIYFQSGKYFAIHIKYEALYIDFSPYKPFDK